MILKSFLGVKVVNIYKVITSLLAKKMLKIWGWSKGGVYKVITFRFFCLKSMQCNEVVDGAKKSIHNVITSFVFCVYFVITILFCFSTALAKELDNALISLDVFQPIVQGALVYGKTDINADVYYMDSKLMVGPKGEFVFALPKEGVETFTISVKKDNYKVTKTYDVEIRSWKEEVVNGLPPKKVSPSENDLKRIAAENLILKQARENTSSQIFPVCFKRPVDKGARISSEFGSRRVLNGVKTAGHSGTDYALPKGSSVLAPVDGVVKVVHSDMFYSGQTILIDHGYGVFSSYSHLNDIFVKKGQFVKQGDLIGEVGTTGRSTGPHLHFTLTWFGVRVDPEFVLTTYSCDE